LRWSRVVRWRSPRCPERGLTLRSSGPAAAGR
jgi:hypothetical protein